MANKSKEVNKLEILQFEFYFYRINHDYYIQRIIMLSTKQKKFTHNRMKACLERNQNEDKQNKNIPQDFRNKKFSVQLPYKPNQISVHQKSIFNQQISVTLNTSNTKNMAERDLLGSDIKTLTQSLSRQRQDRLPLCQILQNCQIRSIQMKFLVERLLNHIKQETNYHNSSIFSQKDEGCYDSTLSETQMLPYIERQIDVLQKNYEKLLEQKQNYVSIQKIANEQKQKILHTLKQIHQSQLDQLNSIYE